MDTYESPAFFFLRIIYIGYSERKVNSMNDELYNFIGNNFHKMCNRCCDKAEAISIDISENQLNHDPKWTNKKLREASRYLDIAATINSWHEKLNERYAKSKGFESYLCYKIANRMKD